MAYQYNPATGRGEATIRLTNTSDPQCGGYLTGFVFNVLGEATATLEANPTGPFYAVHNPEFASPYGRRERARQSAGARFCVTPAGGKQVERVC